MMPLLVIVQFTHGTEQVRTIIKNVPTGLQSLLVYVLIVAATYGRWGILRGTLVGYAGATVYLLALGYIRRWRGK
jgi:hypothetical protein